MILPAPIYKKTNFDAFYMTHLKSIQITRNVNEIPAWFTRHFVIMSLSSRSGYTSCLSDWSSDVCSSDLSPRSSQDRHRCANCDDRGDGTRRRAIARSEERRVGKEWRFRWAADHYIKI